MVELHRLKGLIRFVPVTVGGEEVLVGRAETGHHVADLLVLHFHERFGRYGIVLLVGERAFVSRDGGEVLIDDAGPYAEGLAQDDFERLWSAYYGSQTIDRRANPRLRRQRLPKRYWSWVQEAAQFASDGS
jgi:probable DNA metabolism protein